MTMSGFSFAVAGGHGAAARHGPAPLQGVAVTGRIRDTIAQYTVTQTYVNPLLHDYVDGAYTFPLHETVAVTAFQAEIDGRTIVGKVAEKAAAREEYEETVRDHGKTASLLEQETPEVFQARIGNIPPGKTISVRVTLVSELKHDAGESRVRFVLPTTVAPRGFGGLQASKLSIDMACVMSKPITSVQSPSHTIEVHVGTTGETTTYAFDPTRARVSLTEDALLDRDLVLVIQSRGLDHPRALVERHPRDHTHAISLTFQPRFALQPLHSCELIFLVDVRSKSIFGDPDPTRAGAALELFLRYIPFENHYFNIITSGNFTLFPASVEFDAESLRVGIQYAQGGNQTGADAGSSFQQILQQRRRDVPTELFVITDGRISNIDQLRRAIRSAVEDGERSNYQPLRVFCLGVGGSVSHHVIESVARAGRGYAQVVTGGERMEKKVFNMLRAGLMPPVTNTAIQWTDSEEDQGIDDHINVGPDGSKPLINLFSELETSPPVVDPESAATPPPKIFATIYQAPFKLPVVCPGARFTAYAILSPATPLPREVVLRGVSPDGPVELRVKVESVVEGETMLHSLAARALARDFEEACSSVHALGRTLTPCEKQTLKHLGVSVARRGGERRGGVLLPLSFNHVAEIVKQKLIDVGETYSLSTKYTSWVAVDEEGPRNVAPDGYVPAGSFVVNVAQQAPSSAIYSPTDGQTHSRQLGAQYQPSFSGCTSGASAFGGPPASPFGGFQASSAPAFGGSQASSAPAFGATPASPFGGFQASSAPAFGATPASPFGGFQASSAPAFGGFQPSSTAGFGANPASPFGGSQASSAPAFGATPTRAFGGFQASSAPAFGGFQASSAPAFGGFQPSSTAAFGANPASPFGGSKASSAPPVGGFQASSALAFGANQASPFGGFQASSAAAFGATRASPFGVASSSLFGSALAPQASATTSSSNPRTRLRSLLQHQSIDGLFPLVPAVAALFSTSVDNLKTKLKELRKQCTGLTELPEDQWEAIWATCLVVEFIKSKPKELQEEWKLAVEKAERRVEHLVKNSEHLARFKAAAKAP